MGKWLKSSEDLLFELRGHVAYVTLNRPDKRNALSFQLMQDVHAALLEADDLTAARCIVLSGAGKDFCAGADVAGGPVETGDKKPDYDPADYRARDNSFDDDAWLTEQISRLRLVIHDMHKPVIAKIHGNCLGTGTDLALNCDLVVAASDARIGFPPVRALGSPANHMWIYLCGPQWAKRMLMTGDVLRGADAARIGLVLDAYAPDELDEEVDRLARRIALIPSDLQATHKRIVNLGLDLMGWNTLQRLAAENDSRAHLTAPYRQFFETGKAEGFKAALKMRDDPYGDRTGDSRADSVVKLNILGDAK